MEGMKMSVSGKEGVGGADETNYVWGEEKPKGNYKSVKIYGEVYEVGYCVQCNLDSKESSIWKILRLFQVGDRKVCRVRRLFSEPELPRNVQGLEPPAEPKELFLASKGPGMQEDISLGKIARRYTIFCTFQDDDGLNPIPSNEQIKNADYFFHRGYDPTNKEVVSLDAVVDELGAQYVYNKAWWLVDNVARRSSSQISAARIHAQSPASGSSAHQVVTKGMYSSSEVSPALDPEISPAPSRDSTERKLKRKSDNLAPEQHKVDAVEKKNKFHSPKKSKVEKSTISRSDHVVFAIPAPAMTNSNRRQCVPPVSAKPPASTSKPIQREEKSHFLKPSSSPALVGSKQAELKGEVSADVKGKDVEIPSEGIVKTLSSTALVGSKQADAKGGVSADVKGEDGEMSNEGIVKTSCSPTALVGSKQAEIECGVSADVKGEDREMYNEGIVKTSSSPTALVGSTQAETKGGVSANRKRKDGEMPSEGKAKTIVAPGERLNAPSGREKPSKLQRRAGEKPSEGTVKKRLKPGEKPSAPSRNPSKLQKRADEDIVMTTSHATRKVLSAPTSLPKKVNNLTVEIPTVNPSTMKTGRNVSSVNPQASKEVMKTDVGSRMVKRDDDVAQAPSTSQRQSGSPSLDMSARKITGPTTTDPSPKLSPLEVPKSPSNKDIDFMNVAEPSPVTSPQQKVPGQVFKPKIEDWDSTISIAIQSNRVLLLKNVDPELHSEDLAEALTHHMRTKCEVRIAPPVSFSYGATTALLKLPSSKKAQEFLKDMESKFLTVANRLLTATIFSQDEFKGPQVLKYPGHLEYSQVRDHHVEDYKNALATSHLAQGNTIEFAYGLPWRVLDEQHEEQWRMLQEAHTTMNAKARVR